MERAIKLAVEGGYGDYMGLKSLNKFWVVFNRKETTTIEIEGVEKIVPITQNSSIEHLLLDPEFWQCLGKSLWKDDIVSWNIKGKNMGAWLYYWHHFIDWISEGKDISSYFEEIIKTK